MAFVESFSKVSRQKIRGRALGIRLILMVIFVLSASALGISQDSVENFEFPAAS